MADQTVDVAVEPLAQAEADIFDVSQRTDVSQLRKGAIGLAGVLFLTVTGSAPISAMASAPASERRRRFCSRRSCSRSSRSAMSLWPAR